jgi:hypothetical protein
MDLARRGDEHPDRRRLAAPGARARPADVAERVLAKHEVREGLLVAVRGRRGGKAAEQPQVAREALQRALASGSGRHLVDHHQRIVALGVAHLDALRAALAVDRVDEQAERRGLEAATGRDVGVLRRPGEPLACRANGDLGLGLRGGMGRDRGAEHRFGLGRGDDRAVRAGRDAGHAPDAPVEEQLRDPWGEAAEVAGPGRTGRDGAAGGGVVARQLGIGHAAAIGVDHGRIECACAGRRGQVGTELARDHHAASIGAIALGGAAMTPVTAAVTSTTPS